MYKIKHTVCFLLTIIICVSSCRSQINNVSVKINIIDDKGNNIPEDKMKLYNKDTILISQTNLDGILEFYKLRKGKYKIDVSSFGNYTMKNIIIKLKSSEEQLVLEVKSVEVGHVDVEWDGGWVTYEDKDGNIKTIRCK